MKKLTRKLLIGMSGVAMATMAGQASAGIAGSAHDLSVRGVAYTGGQICVVCHTPHGSDTSVVEAPLWNHTLSSVASYTVYSSNTLTATVGQPDGVSKLCLSCHDGTVAVDNFGGALATVDYKLTDPYNVGGPDGTDPNSLKNDHPISFTYDSQLVTDDGGLFPTSKAITIGSATTKTKSGTIASLLLSGTKVQCTSCHDVHNTYTTLYGKLLKITNDGSALCLTCHDK